MTFDRRDFLNVGGIFAGAAFGGAALAGGMPSQAQAASAPVTGGRSVADFGVEPNSDKDQTAAMQNAIDEIAKSGHPVFIPGGNYAIGSIKLPNTCAIIGVLGKTTLRSGGTIFTAQNLNAIALSGLSFGGGKSIAKHPDIPRISFSGVPDRIGSWVSIQNCKFVMAAMPAISLSHCAGLVQCVSMVIGASDYGILATDVPALTISQCLVEGGKTAGIKAVSQKNTPENGVIITGNHVRACKGAAIAVEGNAIVTGNQVATSGIGLRLGGGGEGYILASNNLIRECDVGVGAAASGETIFASLNLINAPKNGGVRALNGDKLIGPDLTQKSAEAYMNLTLGGNVVR
ncbi:MAG: right-handed parallel beta-helix repeat-containing protein [Alphaproteobacteria bacterium]